MKERVGVTVMKGNSLTLLGEDIKVGDKAPDFSVVANDLSPFTFSSMKGKTCILLSVPSIDTPVCDIEVRRFNKEATSLGSDVHILMVSMDLPFAQKRWCGAASIDRVVTLSDHKDASFGTSYGMLIKEVRLLARGVFVVDKKGIIQHAQLVKELTSEPDYNSVLKTVKEII
jgi:thioredoxin-dependent peroxiredoxin